MSVEMPTGAIPAAEAEAEASALQPVASKDLADFDQTEQARRLEVIEHDKELVHRLMWRSYEGPEWRAFATALAEYGYQVICVWAMTGVIFLRCQQKGIGVGPPNARRTREDIEDLARETIVYAIRAFRERVLIPGKWDPTRGANLKTFFIGQCIFQFPNVYRRWQAETAPPPVGPEQVAAELAAASTPRLDVERLVELKRACETLTDREPRAIDGLLALGYTQVEVAEMVGTTVKSIESRLYRRRKDGGHEQ